MVAEKLTQDQRVLLEALVHSDDPYWWEVIPDKVRRNAALDMLKTLRLIEVGMFGVRATSRGCKSNAKARRLGLI